MNIIIIIFLIYLIGAIWAYQILRKDLVEGAATFCMIFSWFTLFFLGLGELCYWLSNKKNAKKDQEEKQ